MDSIVGHKAYKVVREEDRYYFVINELGTERQVYKGYVSASREHATVWYVTDHGRSPKSHMPEWF